MIANRVAAEPATHSCASSAAAKAAGPVRALRLRILGGTAITVIASICLAGAAGFGGQQSAPSNSPEAEQQQEQVNASRAAQDMEVGTFYMHKGDYGAAISRFEDAVQLDRKEPKARLLLAEAYEKQGDRTHALDTYRDYLKTFPNSKDDKKVRKKIAELERKRD